jgi:RimJ/RimL family protein N-acetyltransferase
VTHPLWPLFDLRIRSEHLTLRLPTDDELIKLAALARSGIHPPDQMPFGIPWSTSPSPQFEIGFVQHHWGMRATWTPKKWWLNLAVERDGTWVAAQTIAADDFAVFRTVDTGSWVAQRYQQQGIGTEMRGAVLAFAFDHLGAQLATSEAFLDNAASIAVSRSLGYEPNGFGALAPEGKARETARYRMTRQMWESRPRQTVDVEGLEACRGLFGLRQAVAARSR